MTELNETIEEADPDAENVSPEDNAITEQNRIPTVKRNQRTKIRSLLKIGCQLQSRRNYSLSRKT